LSQLLIEEFYYIKESVSLDIEILEIFFIPTLYLVRVLASNLKEAIVDPIYWLEEGRDGGLEGGRGSRLDARSLVDPNPPATTVYSSNFLYGLPTPYHYHSLSPSAI
jgi:hypothetical protein